MPNDDKLLKSGFKRCGTVRNGVGRCGTVRDGEGRSRDGEGRWATMSHDDKKTVTRRSRDKIIIFTVKSK
jgi:predicted Fe-S protein YdhL (DUF1289 family)